MTALFGFKNFTIVAASSFLSLAGAVQLKTLGL